jgi:hypothetical protein
MQTRPPLSSLPTEACWRQLKTDLSNRFASCRPYKFLCGDFQFVRRGVRLRIKSRTTASELPVAHVEQPSDDIGVFRDITLLEANLVAAPAGVVLQDVKFSVLDHLVDLVGLADPQRSAPASSARKARGVSKTRAWSVRRASSQPTYSRHLLGLRIIIKPEILEELATRMRIPKHKKPSVNDNKLIVTEVENEWLQAMFKLNLSDSLE